MLHTFPKAASNDPSRKGERASAYRTFGDNSRFGLVAVHTRFEAVEWHVVDVEQIDEVTGTYGAIIRQEATAEAAVRGLS
jgi:hypothetical protein